MPELLAPVASPDYLASRGLDGGKLSVTDIAALDLIDYERFNAHWISFRQWFGRLPNPPRLKLPNPRFSFSTYIMAIDAALRGDGIALGSLGLIDEQIADGQLVRVGPECLATGYGYYLGLPKYKTVSAEAMHLHARLLEQRTV
jgi:DNA-binding transcriptional LysR family regulator